MPSTTFVVILGISTVFIGLIGLIILCKMLSVFCNISKKQSHINPIATTQSSVPPVNETIENRQEIVAAVSAAIAEDLGTDISALKILSFKKI